MATKISRKTLISLAAAGASLGFVEPVRGLAKPTDWPVINSSTAMANATQQLIYDVVGFRKIPKAGTRRPGKIAGSWNEVEAFLRYMADEIEHYRHVSPENFPDPKPLDRTKHKRPDGEPPN